MIKKVNAFVMIFLIVSLSAVSFAEEACPYATQEQTNTESAALNNEANEGTDNEETLASREINSENAASTTTELAALGTISSENIGTANSALSEINNIDVNLRGGEITTSEDGQTLTIGSKEYNIPELKSGAGLDQELTGIETDESGQVMLKYSKKPEETQQDGQSDVLTFPIEPQNQESVEGETVIPDNQESTIEQQQATYVCPDGCQTKVDGLNIKIPTGGKLLQDGNIYQLPNGGTVTEGEVVTTFQTPQEKLGGRYTGGVYIVEGDRRTVENGDTTAGSSRITGGIHSFGINQEKTNFDLNEFIDVTKTKGITNSHNSFGTTESLRSSTIHLSKKDHPQLSDDMSITTGKGTGSVAVCIECDDFSPDDYDGYVTTSPHKNNLNNDVLKSTVKGQIGVRFGRGLYHEGFDKNLEMNYYPDDDIGVLELADCPNCEIGDVGVQMLNGEYITIENKFPPGSTEKPEEKQLRYKKLKTTPNAMVYAMELIFPPNGERTTDYDKYVDNNNGLHTHYGTQWLRDLTISSESSVEASAYLKDKRARLWENIELVKKKEYGEKNYFVEHTTSHLRNDGTTIPVDNLYVVTKEGQSIVDQMAVVKGKANLNYAYNFRKASGDVRSILDTRGLDRESPEYKAEYDKLMELKQAELYFKDKQKYMEAILSYQSGKDEDAGWIMQKVRQFTDAFGTAESEDVLGRMAGVWNNQNGEDAAADYLEQYRLKETQAAEVFDKLKTTDDIQTIQNILEDSSFKELTQDPGFVNMMNQRIVSKSEGEPVEVYEFKDGVLVKTEKLEPRQALERSLRSSSDRYLENSDNYFKDSEEAVALEEAAIMIQTGMSLEQLEKFRSKSFGSVDEFAYAQLKEKITQTGIEYEKDGQKYYFLVDEDTRAMYESGDIDLQTLQGYAEKKQLAQEDKANVNFAKLVDAIVPQTATDLALNIIPELGAIGKAAKVAVSATGAFATTRAMARLGMLTASTTTLGFGLGGLGDMSIKGAAKVADDIVEGTVDTAKIVEKVSDAKRGLPGVISNPELAKFAKNPGDRPMHSMLMDDTPLVKAIEQNAGEQVQKVEIVVDLPNFNKAIASGADEASAQQILTSEMGAATKQVQEKISELRKAGATDETPLQFVATVNVNGVSKQYTIIDPISKIEQKVATSTGSMPLPSKDYLTGKSELLYEGSASYQIPDIFDESVDLVAKEQMFFENRWVYKEPDGTGGVFEGGISIHADLEGQGLLKEFMINRQEMHSTVLPGGTSRATAGHENTLRSYQKAGIADKSLTFNEVQGKDLRGVIPNPETASTKQSILDYQQKRQDLYEDVPNIEHDTPEYKNAMKKLSEQEANANIKLGKYYQTKAAEATDAGKVNLAEFYKEKSEEHFWDMRTIVEEESPAQLAKVDSYLQKQGLDPEVKIQKELDDQRPVWEQDFSQDVQPSQPVAGGEIEFDPKQYGLEPEAPSMNNIKVSSYSNMLEKYQTDEKWIGFGKEGVVTTASVDEAAPIMNQLGLQDNADDYVIKVYGDTYNDVHIDIVTDRLNALDFSPNVVAKGNNWMITERVPETYINFDVNQMTNDQVVQAYDMVEGHAQKLASGIIDGEPKYITDLAHDNVKVLIENNQVVDVKLMDVADMWTANNPEQAVDKTMEIMKRERNEKLGIESIEVVTPEPVKPTATIELSPELEDMLKAS